MSHYCYALTVHLRHWADGSRRRACPWQVEPNVVYGQVKKVYRRRRLVRVIPMMRCGTHGELRSALRRLGLSGRLNTAFIERVHLTLRPRIAALVRRTWSTAQDMPQLLVHAAWWQGYSHFVPPHQSLRVALAQPRERGGQRIPQRYCQRTPALAAGLSERCWTVRELLALPLPSASIGAG